MGETSTKKKLRIVNKSKDSITIDIRNAGGLIKMNWNIFKRLFDVSKEDKKYCYTKEDNNETYNKFRKLLNNAVYAFGKIKDKESPDKEQLETLGKCFNELMTLLDCTKEELNKLVIDKYNDVIKQAQNKQKEKKQQPKQNQDQKPKETNKDYKDYKQNIPTIPVSTFGDLKALQQLKEKMNDKRGS